MSRERRDRGTQPPHDRGGAPPGELDPARSKSVESVEQEIDEIVDALAARERARRRHGDTPRDEDDCPTP